MTTTSWPACLSHQALEIPMMPLPNTATFMRKSLLCVPAGRRHGILPDRIQLKYWSGSLLLPALPAYFSKKRGGIPAGIGAGGSPFSCSLY